MVPEGAYHSIAIRVDDAVQVSGVAHLNRGVLDYFVGFTFDWRQFGRMIG